MPGTDQTERQGAVRHVVGRYDSYDDAMWACAAMRATDAGRPVDVVATDVRIVEEPVPTGVGYLEATVTGTSAGAVAGFAVAVVFDVLGWVEPVIPALDFALHGVAAGALAGLAVATLGHALVDQLREFRTTSAADLGAFEVVTPGPGTMGAGTAERLEEAEDTDDTDDVGDAEVPAASVA